MYATPTMKTAHPAPRDMAGTTVTLPRLMAGPTKITGGMTASTARPSSASGTGIPATTVEAVAATTAAAAAAASI